MGWWRLVRVADPWCGVLWWSRLLRRETVADDEGGKELIGVVVGAGVTGAMHRREK